MYVLLTVDQFPKWMEAAAIRDQIAETVARAAFNYLFSRMGCPWERRKKTMQTEEEVGRQHHGMDRPGVRQVPEGSGEQGKMEKTGCKIICGAPTTLAVKGLMMMMLMRCMHW